VNRAGLVKVRQDRFRAFSDPIRLRILSLVQPGELCVCDLVDLVNDSDVTPVCSPLAVFREHVVPRLRCGCGTRTRTWRRFLAAANQL